MKKAQAAMEFLMTYGWAILVVLAAIAALAYFGVLSPEKFLPTKCVITPGIDCAGHRIEPTQATLVLRNGMGKDITINTIDIAGCSGTINQDLDNGAQDTYIITGCSNGDIQSRFSGDVVLTYTEKNTLLNKTHYGSITTKVE